MANDKKREMVPIWERSLLTLEEAAIYSGIGINTLRKMTENPACEFVLWVGRRVLVKRKQLEKYLEQAYSL